MVCLNWAVLGTALVGFHYSSFLSSHPAGRIRNWLRNNPSWSDHYKRRHSQVFCHNKNVYSGEGGPAWLFLPTFCFFLFFWIFIRSIWTTKGKAPRHFLTHVHKKTDKKKLRAKVKLHDVTLSGLTRPGRWVFVSKWWLSMSDFGLLWRLTSWVRKHLRSWNFGE